MPAFYGYEHFRADDGTSATKWFDADVFFAVFAPGQVNNPYPDLYTYLYLVANDVTSNRAIGQFTVGVPPELITSGDIGNVSRAILDKDLWDNDAVDLAPVGAPVPPFYQTDDGGVLSSTQYTGADSVIYNFIYGALGNIPPGSYSSTLLFTSSFRPSFVTASLQDGGISDDQSVPGPVVPEPTSLLLLGSGLFGLAAVGVKKKKGIA